jgi:hypothetical protein
MKSHRQLAAGLNIAMGALYLLGALGVFIFATLAGGFVMSQGETGAGGLLGLVGLLITGFLVIVGLPSVIGGWALAAGQGWAKPLLIVLSVLHLPNVPLGTALGVYTLWVLLAEEPERERLADQPGL